MSQTKSNLGLLNPADLKMSSQVFRAINHPLRLNIIKLIEENEKMNVTQIYFKLRIEQSVASQHLAILRNAGILTAHRTGKNIHYTVNHKKIIAIQESVDTLKAN